jgi:hypothetical protein
MATTKMVKDVVKDVVNTMVDKVMDEVMDKVMDKVMVIKEREEHEFWSRFESEILHMIANHLDLQSLKNFIFTLKFISKEVYFSFFHIKSPHNSWKMMLYTEFYFSRSIVERGIKRAIDKDYNEHGYDFYDPMCPYSSDIQEHMAPCYCCNCTPKWMTQKSKKVGEIVWNHNESCVTAFCSCGESGVFFPLKVHCNCLDCKSYHGEFDLVQSCIHDGCPQCKSKFVFSPYPEDFQMTRRHFCDGCHKEFNTMWEEEIGHCTHCDTTLNICENCWLEGHYPKRTQYFDTSLSQVSMTEDSLIQFNEFTLDEVINYDKKVFRINRWFRLVALLLRVPKWTPRNGFIERKFFRCDELTVSRCILK